MVYYAHISMKGEYIIMSEKKKLVLTSENVNKIFTDCLFKDNEIQDGEPICEYTVAEGIRGQFYFHSERLEQYDEDISDLVGQLADIEQGPSFFNLCMTKEGNQWGEHLNMEQLVVLGVASGNLQYCLPKQMWSMLPGGMPLVIRTQKENNKSK